MAFARPSHRVGKDMHLQRRQLTVRARQRGDADEGAGLHVGERRGKDERDRCLLGEMHGLLVTRARPHNEARAVGRDALDHGARDRNRSGLGDSRTGNPNDCE